MTAEVKTEPNQGLNIFDHINDFEFKTLASRRYRVYANFISYEVKKSAKEGKIRVRCGKCTEETKDQQSKNGKQTLGAHALSHISGEPEDNYGIPSNYQDGDWNLNYQLAEKAFNNLFECFPEYRWIKNLSDFELEHRFCRNVKKELPASPQLQAVDFFCTSLQTAHKGMLEIKSKADEDKEGCSKCGKPIKMFRRSTLKLEKHAIAHLTLKAYRCPYCRHLVNEPHFHFQRHHPDQKFVSGVIKIRPQVTKDAIRQVLQCFGAFLSEEFKATAEETLQQITSMENEANAESIIDGSLEPEERAGPEGGDPDCPTSSSGDGGNRKKVRKGEKRKDWRMSAVREGEELTSIWSKGTERHNESTETVDQCDASVSNSIPDEGDADTTVTAAAYRELLESITKKFLPQKKSPRKKPPKRKTDDNPTKKDKEKVQPELETSTSQIVTRKPPATSKPPVGGPPEPTNALNGIIGGPQPMGPQAGNVGERKRAKKTAKKSEAPKKTKPNNSPRKLPPPQNERSVTMEESPMHVVGRIWMAEGPGPSTSGWIPIQTQPGFSSQPLVSVYPTPNLNQLPQPHSYLPSPGPSLYSPSPSAYTPNDPSPYVEEGPGPFNPYHNYQPQLPPFDSTLSSSFSSHNASFPSPNVSPASQGFPPCSIRSSAQEDIRAVAQRVLQSQPSEPRVVPDLSSTLSRTKRAYTSNRAPRKRVLAKDFISPVKPFEKVSWEVFERILALPREVRDTIGSCGICNSDLKKPINHSKFSCWVLMRVRSHVLSHVTERAFECPYCTRPLSHLYSHVVRFHKEKIETEKNLRNRIFAFMLPKVEGAVIDKLFETLPFFLDQKAEILEACGVSPQPTPSPQKDVAPNSPESGERDCSKTDGKKAVRRFEQLARTVAKNVAERMKGVSNPADQKFSCEKCQKSFRTSRQRVSKDTLIKHVNAHATVKAYQCPICGILANEFRSHFRKHHPEEVFQQSMLQIRPEVAETHVEIMFECFGAFLPDRNEGVGEEGESGSSEDEEEYQFDFTKS